uniref:Uncharacterized protein n=1 Tax=Geospiza parvula TaxID=87175 RepID=A0A8C3QCE3_GEOPR
MVGMALPRIPWNFPALCWLLAVPIPGSLGLECQQHQYSFRDKCCSDCAPGERMRSRCTASADTVCSPCQDGYFSSQHHHGFCKSCTICNTRKGSVEVKPCEKTSDRACACQAGFQPAGGVPVGRECSRCPEGTFSRGGNKNCQPWTNCSSLGKSTLRAGTGTEDAQCSSPGSASSPGPHASPTEFPERRDPFPTEFPEDADSFPTEFPENSSRASSPREIPVVCRDPGVPTEPGWGKGGQGIHCSCFPGEGIPICSESFSAFHTTFQDPTFPCKAAFLGREFPFSQKLFLYFTQYSRIPQSQQELLSWEGNSYFL